jgi:hypothetical protein
VSYRQRQRLTSSHSLEDRGKRVLYVQLNCCNGLVAALWLVGGLFWGASGPPEGGGVSEMLVLELVHSGGFRLLYGLCRDLVLIRCAISRLKGDTCSRKKRLLHERG